MRKPACKTLQYLHDERSKLDSALVYTTGKISAHPNIHTIIPDEAKFTLDTRHYDPEVIKQVLAVIEAIPAEVERCDFSCEEAWARKSVAFAPELLDTVETSSKEPGCKTLEMFSAPGHNAQFVADIIPLAMLFVPSVGSYSHCEKEFTPTEACAKGVGVIAEYRAEAGRNAEHVKRRKPVSTVCVPGRFLYACKSFSNSYCVSAQGFVE